MGARRADLQPIAQNTPWCCDLCCAEHVVVVGKPHHRIPNNQQPFNDVALDADALPGSSGFTAGMVLTGTLDLGRHSVAAGSVGIIQACLQACAAYAGRRTVGGSGYWLAGAKCATSPHP